jgi:hypothetical protein
MMCAACAAIESQANVCSVIDRLLVAKGCEELLPALISSDKYSVDMPPSSEIMARSPIWVIRDSVFSGREHARFTPEADIVRSAERVGKHE